jgi:hypothetical protein
MDRGVATMAAATRAATTLRRIVEGVVPRITAR